MPKQGSGQKSMEGVIYPTDEKTTKYIESIVLDIINSIRARDITSDSPGFRSMSSDFTIKSDHGQTANKEQTIQYVKETCEQSPFWDNHIQDMSTQFDSGTASVWVNILTDGFPKDTTKSIVLVFGFKQDRNKEWLANSVTTLVGHSADSVFGAGP